MTSRELQAMPALVAVPWRPLLVSEGKRSNIINFEVVQADIYRYIRTNNWRYFVGDGHQYYTTSDERPVR